MRGLVQRVVRAKVTVGEEVTGQIGAGILVFVGVTHDDTEAEAAKLADKIWNLRIFDDVDGVMNRSAADEGHEILVVSQFTLYGDTCRLRTRRARGRRSSPSIPTGVVFASDAGRPRCRGSAVDGTGSARR